MDSNPSSWQQVVQQAHKMSLAARVMCALVVAFYLLSFVPRVEENVAVTPAYIVPPNVKVWTLLTATFYERRIIFVLLDLIAIVGFSSVLQPFWNIKEFALFSTVVGVASLLSGVLVSVLLYAVSQSVSFLPALATLGGFVFHLLVSIKVCPKIERTYDVAAPSRINITLPGTDRVDAQRRKQRALKALDERLSKASNQPQMWPSMEDGSSQDEQDPVSSSASSTTSQPPPPPPPEMVVVETVPGGGGGGEGGGGEGEQKSMESSSSAAAITKTDPAT